MNSNPIKKYLEYEIIPKDDKLLDNLAQAKSLLEKIAGVPLSQEERISNAIQLAAFIQLAANQEQIPREKKHLGELSKMMHDPKGKTLAVELTDQAFRSQNPKRSIQQIQYLISKFGIPQFLSFVKRWGIQLFQKLGFLFPSLAMAQIRKVLQKEASRVIVLGEKGPLQDYMQKKRAEGIRVNLNHLGEAILGNDEAKTRLEVYLKDLENPDVEYISIKISTLYSQIHLIASDQSLEALAIPFRKLLKAASAHEYVRVDGSKTFKFVNLDMEEYKDLHLTVALFKKVLSEPEFLSVSAGIVLQSYVPDSFLIQKELTEFAKQRCLQGGSPLKIRIVKGANLAMEKVEASLKGWPQAPYLKKAEVDANFKRMVEYALDPANAACMQVGIGSHNVFDISYALILGNEKEVQSALTIEMLEGMSEHVRRVIGKLASDLLVYCPVATRSEFQNAVAYLVRRLDENTGHDNFLRVSFGLIPGSSVWQHQANLFASSVKHAREVAESPRRDQNRNLAPQKYIEGHPFSNEPDTDWSLPENAAWARRVLDEWKGKKIDPIPLVIAGQEIIHNLSGKGNDPAHPKEVAYQFEEASSADIELALQTAKKITGINSKAMLISIAEQLKQGRGLLIGAMAKDVGKSITEADPEVSEAIDFATFYAESAGKLAEFKDLSFKSKGVILVASPWNFPCSIPAGGILAALACGNAVIFKPAPEAVLVGYELVKLFWAAGVSKEVLQFVPCTDEQASLLVKGVDAVILTGATETAKLLMKLRPGLDLIAETGGKNSLIVTAMSDRDQAVKDLIQSAFGFSGQKCSACSLAILEKEVFDDPNFKKQLKDAAMSLHVGSQWDLASKVTPLIRPPQGALKTGIHELQDAETWLVEPKIDSVNPHLVSPGIKWGVKPGSFTHENELFGPVLGVISAKNLSEAIRFANATPYGLTSGLHSLDDREHVEWFNQIVAGNCYINRGITGAIVVRQPFGGTKASSFGKGAKAGGPNYLFQLLNPKQIALPSERASIPSYVDPFFEYAKKKLKDGLDLYEISVGNYSYYWIHFFSKLHDPMRLLGQDNIQSYQPYERMEFRVEKSDALVDVLRVCTAAMICKTPLSVSADFREDLYNMPLELHQESASQFVERISKIPYIRVRLLQDFKGIDALFQKGIWCKPEPVLANGRIELLHYLREVALSYDYHRYGNIGDTSGSDGSF